MNWLATMREWTYCINQAGKQPTLRGKEYETCKGYYTHCGSRNMGHAKAITHIAAQGIEHSVLIKEKNWQEAELPCLRNQIYLYAVKKNARPRLPAYSG